MNFYIKNLQISNFLSFFGENDIEIQPFTAIICNFDEGRNDFFKAIDFVFGGILDDFHFEEDEYNNLINPVFLNNADKVGEKECYVEVSLYLIQKKSNLQMRKALENGLIKYYINKNVVSVFNYNRQLESLNVNVKKKNLIFYKNYFSQAIWDDPEALEEVITKILRKRFVFDKLEKLKKIVKRLQELERSLVDREYFHTDEARRIINDFIRVYDAVTEGKESIKERILREIFGSLDEDESPPSSPDSNNDSHLLEEETNAKLERIRKLNENEEELRNRLQTALEKRAITTAKIDRNKIQLARAPNNVNILETQINDLKALLDAKRNELANLEQRLKDAEKEREEILRVLSYETVKMKEIADSANQPRLTPYGRFSDHIRFNHPNYGILKGILGKEIFYGNLIDSFEEAKHCLQTLKSNRWENRESFIVFENYSPDFKDLILASDELGINIEDLEKLQIFLCKLKKFGIIESVPILVNQHFRYDRQWEDANRDVVFVPSNTFISPENIITQASEVEGTFEDEDALIARLNNLTTSQEMKYHEIQNLNQRKLVLQTDITNLENDVDYFKKKLSDRNEHEHPPVLDEHEDPPVVDEHEIPPVPNEPEDPPIPVAQLNEELEEYEALLENLQTEITQINNGLGGIERERGELLASSNWFKRIPRKAWIKSVNVKEKAAMYYDRELERLKNVVSQDEIDFYKSSEEFRETFLASLHQDLEDLRDKVEKAKRAHKNLEEVRREVLIPLIEHCSQFLFSTFQHMLDNVIPFVDLVFGQSEDRLQLVTSLNNDEARVVDFKNLNRLLQFITVLSIFLQITVFEKVPIMILDDIEDFFPKDPIDNVLSPEFLNQLLPETQKSCYDLKMRIGEYLHYFIRKNTPKPPIRQPRTAKEKVSGPCQIIFFSSGDFSLAGESHALLSRKLLPDEYITKEMPYYSNINTLHFQ